MLNKATNHNLFANPPSSNNLQWNARGLTKDKLEECRQFLSLVKLSIALLSETHLKTQLTLNQGEKWQF
jgi:hypothetical protein